MMGLQRKVNFHEIQSKNSHPGTLYGGHAVAGRLRD